MKKPENLIKNGKNLVKNKPFNSLVNNTNIKNRIGATTIQNV